LSTVYTIAFTLFVPVLLVRLFLRGFVTPDYRRRWRERFGLETPDFGPGGRPVWIHAVSVGEAIAATPIIDYLTVQHPDTPVIVTTTTATGAATVARRFGKNVEHRYFPYDLPSVVRRFLRRVDPRMLILMETELWPNLLQACAVRHVPVIVANARLSARSASRYAWFPAMTRAMIAAVNCFGAQSARDRERFIDLGAIEDAVVVTGSLKFDIELPPSIAESGQAIRRRLGTNRTVIMGGSTREGEEDVLLDVFGRLLPRHPDLLLVIAPRHPERFDVVAEICRKRSIPVIRHSEGGACTSAASVFLIDGMGELPAFYAACDVAFVGGSLVPKGGHNVLEPAAMGIPIVVGMHTFNFLEIVDMLHAAGALERVRNVDDLAAAVDRWLCDGDARDRAGASGRAVVEKNRGAAMKLTGIIEQLFENEGGSSGTGVPFPANGHAKLRT